MTKAPQVDGYSDMESKQPSPSWWGRRSRRSKLLVAVGLPIVILGLALGLGLGLGLNQGGGNDNSQSSSPSATSTSSPLPPTPTNASIWQPKVASSWQIVLLQPIKIDSTNTSVTPDVDVFDIDLFDNPKASIDALHGLGKKVICYFSAGSYEENRPDSSQFVAGDKGKELDGWPGEYWLNTSSTNVRSIMTKRLELASQKGCDAVDPDNIDGYNNENGLSLTQDDAINYIHFLSSAASTLNLSIGLKNAAEIIPSVLPAIQFSVDEQCIQYSECTSYAPFINASKPVFHIEYPSAVKASFVPEFCKDSGDGEGSTGFSTVIKNMNLDGWVQYCDGTSLGATANTTVAAASS